MQFKANQTKAKLKQLFKNIDDGMANTLFSSFFLTAQCVQAKAG